MAILSCHVSIKLPPKISDGQRLEKNLQYLEKVTAALVASLSLGLFFLTAARLGSPTAAGMVTLFLATGSGVFTTVGLGTWQHGGVLTPPTMLQTTLLGA